MNSNDVNLSIIIGQLDRILNLMAEMNERNLAKILRITDEVGLMYRANRIEDNEIFRHFAGGSADISHDLLDELKLVAALHGWKVEVV